MELDRVIAVRNDKTVYRDGDACIKVFAETYRKDDVLNEALNQARVEQTGLNVPELRAVTQTEGKWAIVSEYIAGRTLDCLMRDNPEKTETYLDLFTDIQKKIHSVTVPLLIKQKDKMRRKILQSDVEATLRYDLIARLDGMPRHSKLCHGDFNPSNVILRSDGTPFVVDWAHASVGNASADAARTYLGMLLSGECERAERYLAAFSAKSRTKPTYIEKWFPIVAAAISVDVNAEEREILLKRLVSDNWK